MPSLVEIGIVTSGDPSGAEEVATSIVAVGDAAVETATKTEDAAQRQADAMDGAAEAARMQAEAFEEAAAAQKSLEDAYDEAQIAAAEATAATQERTDAEAKAAAEKAEADRKFYAEYNKISEAENAARAKRFQEEEQAAQRRVEARRKELEASKAAEAAAKREVGAMVPAWEQTGEAAEGAAEKIEEASDAMEAAGDAGTGLDDVLDQIKGRARSLRDQIDESRGAISGMGEAAAGASGSGALGRLGKMVGGAAAGMGTFVTMFTAGMKVLGAFIEKSREFRADAAETSEALSRSLDASVESRQSFERDLNKAMTSASGLAAELGRLSAIQAEANQKWEDAANSLESLNQAQDELAKSEIDLKVARGELSATEAAEMKGGIDIAALERRAALKVEMAESDKASSDAELSRAASAEAIAEAEAKAAAAKAEEVAKDGTRRMNAAHSKVADAEAVAGLDPFAANSAAMAIDLAGGEEAVRDMIEEMKGAKAYAIKLRLYYGASLESVLGAEERLMLAEQMLKQAEKEAEGAKTMADENNEAARKVAQEKAKEYEALKKSRETAEASAKEAGRNTDIAKDEQMRTEQFIIPAARNRIEAGRAAEQRRNQKQEEDDNARRAQEDAQRRADAEARGIGGDATRMARNAERNGEVDPALVRALGNVGDKQMRTEQFIIPAARNRIEAGRAAEQRRNQKQEEDDNARRAQEDAQRRADAEARGIGGDATRMARNAERNGEVDQALVRALGNVGDKFADGTDQRELSAALERLLGSIEGAPAKQRDALAPLIARIGRVEAMFDTFKSSH
ncbi:MAG TPA: hypothetical protein PLA50_04520 [Bacteroidia bacterium]|nr:hypothetical protein [Bacteroidia bacterium]